jgi:amino acid transporter
MEHQHNSNDYKKNSLTLLGAVSLGTGVMIGAGILALTGQIAQLANQLFPLAFLVGFIISLFSAYSYIKMSNKYPSAGGIAMYLSKIYGNGITTAFASLLMYFSMVINESLVAKTFGTYTLQLFDQSSNQLLVTALGVGLLIFAFFVNIAGNNFIEKFQSVMSFIKILGLLLLALGALYLIGFDFDKLTIISTSNETSLTNFLGAVALAILAFKGFTTINNTGSEIVKPHKNVGKAILIALFICFVLYMLVAVALNSVLSIEEIVQARDFSLAEASKPIFGDMGLYITVLFAIFATVSGVIASVFAVSRMLAMLADMKLVPYSDFNVKGTVQRHTLVYTIFFAIVLTVFFDLSRIATLGAIFYIMMDIAVHYGILKHFRKDIGANPVILASAILLDVIVLASLVWVKATTDSMIIAIAIISLVAIFGMEYLFLRKKSNQ